MNTNLEKAIRALAPHFGPLRDLLNSHDRLVAERNQALADLARLHPDPDAPQGWPPGHFYSPIPKLADVRAAEKRLFEPRREIAGIDHDEQGQLELLRELLPYYRELDFPERREPRRRYFFENPAFSWSDAIFLHCMIRHHRPRRIIEVGSGYSSCMTLDTNDQHFGFGIRCTFIEPYPQLLQDLVRPEDLKRIEIIPRPVQEVPVERFRELEENDILFIDSTHTVKAAGDVEYLYFEVLPALRPGVIIHIHDIFRGFQLPLPWILEGRQWSEASLLRAFLMYNANFRILLFNTFLELFHRDWFEREMPLCLRNDGGQIWLRKLA